MIVDGLQDVMYRRVPTLPDWRVPGSFGLLVVHLRLSAIA